MKKKFSMSRRTAGWLMALLAAFVVMHYAYQKTPGLLSRAVTTQPAIQVALRGEITHLQSNAVNLTLEDPHGNLTTLSRTIQLTGKTQYLTPGEPPLTGNSGLKYLQKGYRVFVKGRGTADNHVIADVVHVSFPPITGTLSQLSASQLSVKVPHQPVPATIALTSHTAIYVPQGNWSQFKVGSPIKVWVVPISHGTHSNLAALSVIVLSATSNAQHS